MRPHSNSQENHVDSRLFSTFVNDNYNPVVIVGIGCRLPGGVSSSSKLWEFLENEKSGQGRVPKSRFNVGGFYHPDGAEKPGSMNTSGGYFLDEDIREFDNEFFGINPLEATYMDPQQRKLLEVVYESFESAGCTLEELSGSNTGCYVGNFSIDFLTMQMKDPEYLHRYAATGMGTTILSNRISHVFNLKGPSLVLDTACSSSLYCFHAACTALENGECDAAIVAAANLIQSPEQHLATMKAGVLSATSTCHSFSDEADGYGRAEGIGSIYLKRLNDAIAHGDPIRAIVRGTAVNSNGRTPGITMPSVKGQEEVIRKCYSKAGLSLNETLYVECHGTGTAVGDPIELEALGRVFGSNSSPLIVGSVKSGLGHSEATSAISGIIKTVLALECGRIPATIGVHRLNPSIKMAEWNLDIVTKSREWHGFRRAGVNSFGYGGANAHIILEQVGEPRLQINCHRSDSATSRYPQRSYLIPISASSVPSLQARATDLAEWPCLEKCDIGDLVNTLSLRRSHMAKRGFLVAGSSDKIKGLFQNENLRVLDSPAFDGAFQYAFVFTGQGAQWAQMCIELYNEFIVFRECIEELDGALQSLPEPPSWSLAHVLIEPASTSLINEAEYAQPCCTAIQIAMVRLLASWDIKPRAVVGHSSGEFAAAFSAGCISSSQAIIAAYYRGFVVSKAESKGAMMVVSASPENLNQDIENSGLRGKIAVACVNSAESTTLSGDIEAIDAILGLFQERKVFARKLNTGGRAYHSHQMLALGEMYQALIDAAFETLGSPKTNFDSVLWISSVTGQPKYSYADGIYWRANLESPVLFASAIRRLFKEGKFYLMELGPHSALEMPIKQLWAELELSDERILYSSAITRGKNSAKCILKLIGSLFLQGDHINFKKVNGLLEQGAYKVLHDLPPYRWNYDRILWNECRASIKFRQRKYRHHELLGSEMLGGDGVDRKWRNLLRTSDVPWLRDHKLHDTVVLPGAAYIAMAIEAASQILGLQPPVKNAFQLQNTKFLCILRLPTEPTASIELFTSLRSYEISSSSVSKPTWVFTITSFSNDNAITHCTGLVSSSRSSVGELAPKSRVARVSVENTASRTWYQSLARGSLNFGPSFQSISSFYVPRMRDALQCTSEVSLSRLGFSEPYILHPITIDAMLQTSIVATAAGSPRDLKAQVPVAIDSFIIQPFEDFGNRTLYVNSTAQKTGFGTFKANADLRGIHNTIKAQMANVTFASHELGEAGISQKRHPVLRALWKPDFSSFGFLPVPKFTAYLDGFLAESNFDSNDEGLVRLGACLDLLSHKNPRLKVLELGSENPNATKTFLNFLQCETEFPRCASYIIGHISSTNKLLGDAIDLQTQPIQIPAGPHSKLISSQTFDLIIFPSLQVGTQYLKSNLGHLEDLLVADGQVLILSDSITILPAMEQRFRTLEVALNNGSGSIFLSSKLRDTHFQTLVQAQSVIVVGRGLTALAQSFVVRLSSILMEQVLFIDFDAVSVKFIPPGAMIFSLIELEKPLLSSLSQAEMHNLQVITNNACNLVWVTSGNLLEAGNPNFALASGLARAIMLEQPALKFFTFDLDDYSFDLATTTENIIYAMTQCTTEVIDYEFIQSDGIVHICRFVPDHAFNSAFRIKQGQETNSVSLEMAESVQLSIRKAGQLDSLFFRQIENINNSDLCASDVRVQVKAFGLNAKDLYVLSGKVNTKDSTCSLEFTGIVEAIGSSVSSLKPGDRVVVMAPGHFKTQEIVPQWACQKLRDDEDFEVMSTLSVVYATALYALHDRAHMQPGESILIHCGAGGMGMAAIQIAQLITKNEQIFVTVSTEAKKQHLVDTFGIKPSNIFNSRDSSFLLSVLTATGGAGVNVVLNSLTGELLEASWKCVALFGRLIEIGKQDITNNGKLDMTQFQKSATFSAFDLSDLYYHPGPSYRKLWTKLLTKVLELYRSKKITQIEPLRVFDISDITNAFRYFSSGNRMGKIAVALGNPKSILNVQPHSYATKFSPIKSYLMVGCLGGIGRSISRWMFERGARNFVFLGRSGTEKLPARFLIDDLETHGAICKVVRGDVCVLKDVQELVNQAKTPIGGVIQAAMGLNEALFTTMLSHFWHTGIDPKVIGTWNLHTSLESKDSELDFFLMTSSISGTVGTATESNYCAANHFLDMFARYRRSLNLPAISIGLGMISEVGYLHENPDIEALLLRKGIHAISEGELLQIIDLSLSQSFEMPYAYDSFASSHILTGLEPLALMELRKRGFEGNNLVMLDPRASILAQAIKGDRKFGEWNPVNLPSLLLTGEQGELLLDTVLKLIAKSFGNLVLLPAEKIDVTKSLANYGMDSMTAAEFRTWFFQSFGMDISFLELLSKEVNIKSLAERVMRKLGEET